VAGVIIEIPSKENCIMDELKNSPGKKMRILLAGDKTSPLNHLPKQSNSTPVPSPSAGVSAESQGKSESEAPRRARGGRYHFGPAFWTIASVLSLLINLIMIIILLLGWANMQSLNHNLGSAMNIGNYLLGGLFTNFEKMDRAHITTTIPVETTIPVKFDLQLNQETNVVLSRDVTINNALVTVRTGGLNITNALTTIVLPQGTILPVVMSLTVPVDQVVPVGLTVNVDIPLEQTQLHEPFVGLQEVIKPLYCALNPGATNLSGLSICE
jgi:hypothetical protein